MKIALCAVLLGLILGIAPPLYAQSQYGHQESEYYYVSTPIEKIYVHRDGYVVFYRKGVNQMANVLIPAEWFTDPSGKADLIFLGPGTRWPSMSIYYQSGEFSHVRLYVRRERSHETWGVVPLTANLSEEFSNVEGLYLEY